MADSIPSLRRKLAEANAEIARLKDMPADVQVKEVRVEVPVDRVVYREKRVEVPVEKIVYRDRVIKEQTSPEVKTKIVEVPVVKETVRYERVEVPVTVYKTDPALENTIRELQERLRQCQSISVSGS